MATLEQVAFQQLQTYKDEIPDLFIFNEALVMSDGLMARVGSLTASKEHFLPWRVVNNEHDKHLAVDLLECLLRDEVKARMKNDVVSEKKYSDRILECPTQTS